ncbi:MAG: YciI family protein [Planctomycetota bacterium]
MARYMLLLRDRIGEFDDVSPEEMQKVIQAYGAWCEKLGAQHLGGEKLCDGEGRLLRGADGKMAVTDGPFAEAKEVFGGFFLVEAEGYDAAQSLAADCPHLQFGSIEIRAVEEMEGPS